MIIKDLDEKFLKSFSFKSTIQAQVQRELLHMHVSTSDRRLALFLARSLQSQLFFYEVEWGGRILQDGVEDVYMFLDDQEGGTEMRSQGLDELPTGVFTPLTKCYTPSCMDGLPYACSSYTCPRRVSQVLVFCRFGLTNSLSAGLIEKSQ